MAHIARRLPPELLPEALELTRRVFLEFEGPDYPPEGVEEFLRFLEDRETLAGLAFWGSFLEGKLTGVLAAREGHICLLFVDRDHHRQGAARALVQAARDWCRLKGCRNLFAGCPDGGTGLCAALGFTARPGQIWEMTL